MTPAFHTARAFSLRSRLLLGILLPVTLFIVVNSVSLYRQSLAAATRPTTRRPDRAMSAGCAMRPTAAPSTTAPK